MKNLTEIIIALIAAYTLSNGGFVEKNKPLEKPKSYHIKSIKSIVKKQDMNLEYTLRGARSKLGSIPTGDLKLKYDSMMRYGKELVMNNRYEEALLLYKSAERVLDTDEVCYRIARIVYEHKKNPNEALRWAEKALDINPNYTPAKFLKYQIESKK